MNKKVLIILTAIFACIAAVLVLIPVLLHAAFSAQYNSKGISSMLVITIDRNQPKEYLGKLDDYDVFIENLNIEGTNFRSIKAENIPIKYALDNDLVIMDDLKNKAWKTIKNDEIEIWQYDAYEIAKSDNELIIRPKS